jgi:hypothetical protein
MFSTTPLFDTSPDLPFDVQKSLERRSALLDRMRRFAQSVSANDFAELTGQGEKVQYNNVHKSMKTKGGKPPFVYTAVEMLVDFQRAMSKDLFDEALPLYYSLKRLLRR